MPLFCRFFFFLFGLLLLRCRSLNDEAGGLLGGTDLLIFLNDALVESARTEPLVLRQEGVRLLILVAAERRQRPPSLVGGNSNQFLFVL